MADLDALVASPWWRWMPGMRWARDFVGGQSLGDRGGMILNDWDAIDDGGRIFRIGALLGMVPDLTDPATVGCLLALAREAWSCDQYRRLTIEPAGAGWCVVLRNGTHRPPSRAAPGWRLDRATGAWPANCAPAWGDGPFCTEADALIAAILAAPPLGVGCG